jgi:hypothetical protein
LISRKCNRKFNLCSPLPTATRYSNQLKTHFNIKISQIELLGSTTVGKLNEMIGKASTNGGVGDESAAADDGAAKYGEPLISILNDRLAYDEPYTTDASPHQYRIWLAQASVFLSVALVP